MGRVLPLRPRGASDWLPTPLPAPPPGARPTGANPYAHSSSSRPAAEPRAPHRPGRRLRRGAGIAVVVTVLTGGVIAGLHSHRTTTDTDEGTSTSAPSATATFTAGPQVSWTTRQGVAFPVSATAGPTRHDGDLAAGFTHDDLGAALAAAWMTYQASPSPGPAVYRAALAREVTGPGEPGLAATVAADYESLRRAAKLPAGSPLGDGAATFTAYAVAPLPDGNRHATLYERAPDEAGALQAFALDVVLTWSGSDWEVVAPTSGSWVGAVTELSTTPAGATAFAPAAPAAGGAS